MKMTKVNHGGVIQNKFIIKDMIDVREYISINATQYANIALGIDADVSDENIRDYLKTLAKFDGDSIIMASAKVADKKIMAIQKQVLAGYTVVVNMAGGYTLWDDTTMSIVNEDKKIDADSKYLPVVDVGLNKVLILENQENIPTRIQSFVKNVLKQDSFSSIKRLNTDYNVEIGKWIGEAIKSGCDTIVAETQLADKKQLRSLAAIFDKLPLTTFHIFTDANIKSSLSSLVGEVKADDLFNKHNINVYDFYNH